MVLDTSALLVLLFDEPEAEAYRAVRRLRIRARAHLW